MKPGCVARPKEFRLTIAPGAAGFINDRYLVVDGDAPFCWRGYKVEWNYDFPTDGGFTYRFFDHTGYSPQDLPLSINQVANSQGYNAGGDLANGQGAGQCAVAIPQQLIIPPRGHISVQLAMDSNFLTTGLIKFTFVGVKIYGAGAGA